MGISATKYLKKIMQLVLTQGISKQNDKKSEMINQVTMDTITNFWPGPG